jgi:hypothetical protein
LWAWLGWRVPARWARRCPAAVVAGADAPAKGQCGLDDTRAGGVEWMLGKVLSVLAGDGIEWKAEFTERRPWWPAAEQGAVVVVRARGRRVGAIYRWVNACGSKPSLQCQGMAAHRHARPWQGGTGRTGGHRRCGQPARVAWHVEGETPRLLGACTCVGKRGASGGAASGCGRWARTLRQGCWRAGALQLETASVCLYLTAFLSKIFN